MPRPRTATQEQAAAKSTPCAALRSSTTHRPHNQVSLPKPTKHEFERESRCSSSCQAGQALPPWVQYRALGLAEAHIDGPFSYWASGSAPADTRWNPLDPARSLHRPAPASLPHWAEPDYVAHNVAEFQRTGFHGGLNYYRAAEPYFYLSAAWKGAQITQPSFYVGGKSRRLGGALSAFRKAARRPSRSRGESRNRQCGPLDTTRSLSAGQ
jgi:hypothetical protein